MLCYAGERLGVAFCVFLRGSGSFGSTVTNISGSTGFDKRKKLNLDLVKFSQKLFFFFFF